MCVLYMAHSCVQEDFQFPLASTTQHLVLNVLTKGVVGDVFLGRAVVPVAQLQEASDSGEVWQSPADMSTSMLTPPSQVSLYRLLPREKGEKVTGQLKLHIKVCGCLVEWHGIYLMRGGSEGREGPRCVEAQAKARVARNVESRGALVFWGDPCAQ